MRKIIVLLVNLLVFSGISAFAAGYEVIKEPWIETGEKDLQVHEDYGIGNYARVATSPTIFLDGVSAVYTDVQIMPGMEVEYMCHGTYYLVDEWGNVISEPSSEIWKSPLSVSAIMGEEYANSTGRRLYIMEDWWGYNPEMFGLKEEPFNSEKYMCIGTPDRVEHSYYNGLARVANVSSYDEMYTTDYKVGIVDKDDNIILPFGLYDGIFPISENGVAWVRKDGKYGLIRVNNDRVTVKINNEEVSFDQIPLIINGRTLTPVRAIFEKLGAAVQWDGDTQTITSTKDDTTITMTIGKQEMYKNGEMIWLDVEPQIIGERTLVPVRAIAEAFECDVDWNNDTQTVIITK